MTVYVELVAKLADKNDIDGVLRIAKWVTENIGRSEPLATEIIRIINTQNELPASIKLRLYQAANKLGQSLETDQLTIQGVNESTPEYLKGNEPINMVKVFPDIR